MAEDFEDSSPESIDWDHYFGILRRRAWYFMVPMFVGWLAVWAVSWFLPSVYRSGTLILVEQPSVPTQFVVPNIAGDLQDRLQSITQQILSRTRLLHIIDTFNLYASDRGKVQPDDLVDRMRKDIEIELVRDNHNELSAFNIYFSSPDPKVAQQVTSELSSLFISENLEARQAQSENTTKFLQSQLDEAGKSLAEQEEKVRQFKDQHLGELPGQLQSNLQILGGMQNQLQTEEDALNRAKQQNVYLESLLGQYKSLQRSGKSGDNTQVGLPALDKELERLKAQLADLSSHYTDQHPDVRKVKDQIARTEKMKQQIAANIAKGASDPANNTDSGPKDASEIRDMSPVFEMQSQLKANQIEITNRQRSIQELEGRIGGYQGRLNQSPVREQQLTDLTRGYEQSRTDYDSLLKKKNDSELASSMERQQQGEHFRILDPPSLPSRPFSPNRLKLFGIGLAAGLLLGGAFAAASEFADSRLYTERELKNLITVDVIAEIPPLWNVDEKMAVSRKTWHRWAAASVISACILVGFAITYLRG